MVLVAGAAQPGGVLVAVDHLQAPDLGVEVGGLGEGGDAQFHGAQFAQPGYRGVLRGSHGALLIVGWGGQLAQGSGVASSAT